MHGNLPKGNLVEAHGSVWIRTASKEAKVGPLPLKKVLMAFGVAKPVEARWAITPEWKVWGVIW